jgi:hypothetical protein
MQKIMAFICPLSDPNTDIRNRSDAIKDVILQEIADELNYEIQRADFLSGRNIMQDIIDMLYNADVVIADLSDLNVNVFYELGLYHAIKGNFITIMQDKDTQKIPFDVKYFRVNNYEYPFSDGKKLQDLKQKIKKSVVTLENQKNTPCFLYEATDVSRLFNFTVVSKYVTSKKEHYAMAKELFNKKCKNIFLMQRSSSVILGAEGGWNEEGDFYNYLMEAIKICDNFYHIISLEGITAHLKRKDSVFPNFKNFTTNLTAEDGRVAIKVKRNDKKRFFLKRLPKDESDPFFKLDRQARVLVVQYEDNVVKTVMVQNLGSDQTCFLLEGNEMGKYLRSCIDYFHVVDYLLWSEIEKIYELYEEINNKKHLY